MSKEHNDPNKRFIDTIPSVSLKKNGIPSTQDILDVISYLEEEKKLASYQAMVHYLNTTDIEALDDYLKEMGLESSEAVKQVVDGIKGLKKVNTDFKRLHYNLAPYAQYSSYLSNMNNLVKPFAVSPMALDGLADAIKRQTEMPAINALQDALSAVRVSTPDFSALQEALDKARLTTPAVDALQEALDKVRISTPAINALQDALSAVRVSTPDFSALQEALYKARLTTPTSTALQETIQQINPRSFEPFLPESKPALVKGLKAARKLDRRVDELVETLEQTETGLAKTTRSVIKAYKPKPARISIKDQSFLKDLYSRSAKKTGEPDTSVSFRIFDPSDSDKLEIALYLDDLGLVKVRGDYSVSITQKGAKFVEVTLSQKPPDKKKEIAAEPPDKKGGPPDKKGGPPDKKKEIPPESNDLVKPIFLGHGHEQNMKKKVIRALTAWNINYQSLEDEPDLGRPNIGKFLDVCDDLDCGVVLLSPDDECYKKREDIEGAQTGEAGVTEKSRARQNVIWELGYCYGHFGEDRTIIVYKKDEEFEWPSNLGDGIGYVPYNDTHWRQKFKRELKARGYGKKSH